MTNIGVALSPFEVVDLQVGAWEPVSRNPELSIQDNELTVQCPQVRLTLRYTPQPGLVQQLPEGRWGSQIRSLAEVPDHHEAGKGLDRYAFVGAAMHGALHHIWDGSLVNPDYCDVHQHADAGELNILIPGDPARPLQMELVNGEGFRSGAPLNIFIPPNTDHAANAVSGTGFFFILRVPLES